MLTKLFGSNTRTKILKHFLFNPGQRFYIRQLARDLGLQVNSVRRELENLEDFGLLISENGQMLHTETKSDEYCLTGIRDTQNLPKQKEEKEKVSNVQEKKYYKVNTDFPIYQDIRSVIVKSQMLYKDELAKELLKVCNPGLLVLTGFFVNKPEIGVDILIVGRVNKDRLRGAIKKLEQDLERELNFTVMEMEEFKYRREIADIFLYGVLDNEKIVLVNEIGL